MRAERHSRARLTQLGNDPTAIGHQHDLPVLYLTQVAAEAILELLDRHCLHVSQSSPV